MREIIHTSGPMRRTDYYPPEDAEPRISPYPIRLDCGIEVYQCQECGGEVEGSNLHEECRLERWERELPRRVEQAYQRTRSAIAQAKAHGMSPETMLAVLLGLHGLLSPEPSE